MTDYEIADSIAKMIDQFGKETIEKCTLIYREGKLELTERELVNSYYLKKTNAIAIEIPELSSNRQAVIAQIALAVGRRLERFERGQKANAGRDANSRKEIAQNAIQARWNAK